MQTLNEFFRSVYVPLFLSGKDRKTFTEYRATVALAVEILDDPTIKEINLYGPDFVRVLQGRGYAPASGVLWQIHSYLTPGGRATRRLSEGVRHYPVKHFEGDSCANTLVSTWHFHIDPYGNLFTGHCPGIAVATVENLHPAVSAEELLFYTALLEGGPVSAWQRLAPEFEPSDEGYIGKCHFCLELRRYLLKQENPPKVIRPMDMYQP